MIVYKNKTEKNPVKSRLAMTPKQMDQARQAGQPISTSTLPDSMFDDGYVGVKLEIPIDRQRGIDVAQIWQETKTLEKKIGGFKRFTDTK
jgi:hypothetical protein